MGCKATKTGVLMKLLVCASIYVLLFGVLNSNKLYLLAFFFIFKLQVYLIITLSLGSIDEDRVISETVL